MWIKMELVYFLCQGKRGLSHLQKCTELNYFLLTLKIKRIFISVDEGVEK